MITKIILTIILLSVSAATIGSTKKTYVNYVELSRIETLEYIKAHEGLRLTPYTCPGGFNTVGYGHRTESTKRISIKEADSLLESDFAYAMDVARRDGFHGHQRIAIAHFVFCFGETKWLKKFRLRKLLKSGRYSEAFTVWRRYVKCKGKTLEPLKSQREYEIRLFNAGF